MCLGFCSGGMPGSLGFLCMRTLIWGPIPYRLSRRGGLRCLWGITRGRISIILGLHFCMFRRGGRNCSMICCGLCLRPGMVKLLGFICLARSLRRVLSLLAFAGVGLAGDW